MHPTPYPHVNALLDELLAGMQGVLGDKLVGLYLFGSTVTAGYDDRVSDIDLLAATAADIDDKELEALRGMHHDFVERHPEWDDRIEVAYLSVTGLQTFKTQPSRLAIISPGEPLHAVEAGRDWLLNWYLVLEADVTLFGPPPSDVIAPVSQDEYVAEVRNHALSWGETWGFPRDRGGQSYAVLTMCRALYTHRTGNHTSKSHAAPWAQQEFPEWAGLIQEALATRAAPGEYRSEPSPNVSEAVRFVRAVQHEITENRS
jgi:Aminoglycoside adenylyltransferase, C-terminal domain